MRLFRILDTNRHVHLRRILSMCLVLCFLMSFQVTIVMAAGNGTLASLSVSGTSVIDFDPAQTEYTVYIPQCYENGEAVAPEVPTVYAVAEDPDTTNIDIDYPEAVETGSIITVTVTPPRLVILTIQNKTFLRDLFPMLAMLTFNF